MRQRRLEKYRGLDYNLPERTMRWQLSRGTLPDLELVEDARPRPKSDEVAFRVDTNAICFSDVKVLRNPTGHPRMAGYDLAARKLVPGHETAITITEVGADISNRFHRGERYLVQADLARSGQAVGYDVWGGMTQFGVWGANVLDYLVRLPDEMGYSQSSLVEPWACVEASYRRADIRDDDRAVLLLGGAGPMGQMHLDRAINMKRIGRCGALELIVVTDVSAERLATVARRHGGRAAAQGIRLVCVNPIETPLERAVGTVGFDYIVALAPIEKAVLEAKRLLREYGVLNVFAGFPRGTGALNMGDMHYDQHTVTGNSGSTLDDMRRVLMMAQEGALDPNYSVGAVAGFRAGKQAIEDVAAARSSNKIVVYNQLPDMPLTSVEDTARLVRFSAPALRQVAEGVWSAEAENELLEQLLELG